MLTKVVAGAVAFMILVSSAGTLLAGEKDGLIISYGGGFGYYTVSYRTRLENDRGLEFGVGVFPGIELERTFDGMLDAKDKPLKDYWGIGVGLNQYIFDKEDPAQPHLIARLAFDGYHGPAAFLGFGYEYFFGKRMNASVLVEGLLGMRFSKDSYIKDAAPNSKVDIGSTFYGQIRAGIGMYF